MLRGCGSGNDGFGGFCGAVLTAAMAERDATVLVDILGVVMGGGAGGAELCTGENTLGNGRDNAAAGRGEFSGILEVTPALGCDGMARVGGGSFDNKGRGAGSGIVEGVLVVVGVVLQDDDGMRGARVI